MSDPLLQRLQAALSGKPDVVEKGYKTVCEFAKLWGKSRITALRLLSNGLDAGLVEYKEFRLQHKHFIRAVPHYREKK